MSGFKDAVAADIHNVFLNTDEFAEKRTVRYDGVDYVDIPIILNGIKFDKRPQVASDHAQGLYRVTDILHIKRSDLGGIMPERGAPISINTKEGGGFFRQYYIATAQDTVGMLRIELEAIDE